MAVWFSFAPFSSPDRTVIHHLSNKEGHIAHLILDLSSQPDVQLHSVTGSWNQTHGARREKNTDEGDTADTW